ncbi:MAG TPA: DinB family protein [Chitinophagaceae bacterium]|nr:DinB family protein [Chitinophagaceae bacterium]
MSKILINNIIRQLNEIQEGSLWFDQCFKDKIDGLPHEEAFKRPIPEVHSVAEHISHIIEWRKECLLRFKGQRTDLMNGPDDWKDNDELFKIGWYNLKNAFYQSTLTLIDALEDHDDDYLETKFLDTNYDFHYLIEGIIQHDLYHLGQIGITIKLVKQK